MVTYNVDSGDFSDENEGELWPYKSEEDETKEQKARQEEKDRFIQKLQNENQKLLLQNMTLSDKLHDARDEVAGLKHDKANASALNSENRRLRHDNNELLEQNERLQKYVRYLMVGLISLSVVGSSVMVICGYSKSKLAKENMVLKEELMTQENNFQKSIQKSR